jgi:hypothetical protein
MRPRSGNKGRKIFHLGQCLLECALHFVECEMCLAYLRTYTCFWASWQVMPPVAVLRVVDEVLPPLAAPRSRRVGDVNFLNEDALPPATPR